MIIADRPGFFWNLISSALIAGVLILQPAHAEFSDRFTTGTARVVVTPFASVPNRSNGATAKLNAIVHTGDRLFAVESIDGLIYEVSGGETRLWFDVRSALGGAFDNSDAIEGGLRSVAFHPDFANNGLFYTSQDQARLRNPAPADYLSDAINPEPTDGVVTEWQRSPSGSFSAARELLRIGQPGTHTIKQLMFNPHATLGTSDFGLLYIAHGDGAMVENALGSNRNSALGKILRIDPQPTTQKAYTVPVNNPFIGDSSVLDEVYALGFRNPHNLSFSKSGLLFVADIGSGNVEEINLVVAGADFGWGAREGIFRFLSTEVTNGIAELPINDEQYGYTYPAASFRHDPTDRGGIAVAGGYAVENNSELAGLYVFGEFGSTGEMLYSKVTELQNAVTRGRPDQLQGAKIYRANILFDHDTNSATPLLERNSMLDVFNDSVQYNRQSNRADLRFGQGRGGELYISSKQNNTIYIVNSSQPSVPPGSVISQSQCVDQDRDGVVSCPTDSTQIPAANDPEPVPGACIDNDGDGWGWNGLRSCVATAGHSTAGRCVDNDGDGWGWDGSQSCVIAD